MSLVKDFSTYTVDSIFRTIPQFIQDQDAANGNLLYQFVNSMAKILDQQVNFLVRDNMGSGTGNGLDGKTDIDNYYGAQGWSQAIDIDRCPTYALPWLAQFVGVYIPLDTTLTRAQQIAKMQSRSSFQRGTGSILTYAIAAIVNNTAAFASNPLDPSKVIVMEQTGYAGGYTQDVNSITLLIPLQYLTSTTYAAFNTNNGASPVAYSTYFGVNYNSFNASPIPITSNNYNNYIYRYRPTGIQIFIGGY